MIVDILVLAVLLISALISFLRGVIREILTIAGVIGGVIAAYFGGPLLAPLMRTWITPETPTPPAGEEAVEPKLFDILPYDVVGDVLAYGLIFIVVVGVLSVLSHFLAEGARSLGLGPVDRTLGFVFGLIRGVLLLGILYLPVYLFITDEETKESWFGTSKTHFYLEKTSAAIAEFIPQSAVSNMEKNIDKVNEADQTRKKLEEINLLKGREGEAPSQDMMTSPTPDKKQGGYSDQFREDMDQLFEDKTGAKPVPVFPIAPDAPKAAPSSVSP
jgi:membrane protein required for colicin V production